MLKYETLVREEGNKFLSIYIYITGEPCIFLGMWIELPVAFIYIWSSSLGILYKGIGDCDTNMYVRVGYKLIVEMYLDA